ncbi:xyloglucan O-acetyltransferase [Marchantia polymorpha subsp. ruderalis]|uniref:Pectin O-acetyltransferase 3 n=1 Tax=Marchantia polymorpha TaxID=3197 RepID=A0A2R6XCD3_MARPO|nr:hypothetical protein MARPO_0023s0086 [Marchantia polymorpha]BBN01907.1 hypothetical protein Mp_2g11180 [Marchantia polymorpha subsp. ruderalis]|eukprot:PTQ43770.1 hypothetical protein MARPO_0023s0086 [Marchantia polymorpha]
MAGHQLKKLAQTRGKVLRTSLIDLVPKHWSVYTLLFSTVFFLLFCFLLFDIRTSPTALLLHASNQLGALRAQAGEMYFQSTSGSGSSDVGGSPSLRKELRRRAEDADDDDDDDDDDEKRKSNSFRKRSEDGETKATIKDRWTPEGVPTEGLLAVDGGLSDDAQPEEGTSDSKDGSVQANAEKEDAAEKSVKTVEKVVDSDSSQEEPADLGGRVQLEEAEVENESMNEETVPEKESSEEETVVEESVSSEEGALDTVKPDGGEEGIEEKVENSSRKKEEGKELRAVVSEQEVDEASAPSTNIKEEDSSVVSNSDSSSGEETVSGSVELTGKATKSPSVEKVADEEVVDSEKVTETKKERSKRDEKKKETSKKKPSEPSTQAGLRDVAVDGKCDYSVGKWVYDESYPLYAPDSCPFVDGGFRCVENGRPSAEFQKYRWQPSGCDLPRFDPKNMLERLRGRRLAFVGDSIGRNNWESLLCMLAAAVPNKTRIYEINGEPITKHKGFLSFRFEDYNCTVEYYRSPYLVPQGRAPPNSPPEVHSTFKLDQIDWSATQWKDADIIVFNSGHWWSFEKTVRGGNYFQLENKVHMKMEVGDAFRRAMQTVAKFVEENIDSTKTQTFWRSYAPVHFRGGTWKTGGSCVEEERPMLNHTSYQEPWVNQMISEVIQNNVKNPIKFLNITLLSDYRPDGHSSIWQRSPPSPINRQDCSHWCLPGVPDTWNEFLYAALLDRGQGPWSDKAE